MAKLNFALPLFILSCIFYVTSTTELPQQVRITNNGHSNNLVVACQATRYPSLCVRSLSRFPNTANQNPHQLAQLALAVSLYRARNARSYLLEVSKQLKDQKAREYPVVEDCLSQIGDSIQQLSQSIGELHRLSQDEGTVSASNDDFLFHASNVETWASAAYTDASFCLNELPTQGLNKMKAAVRGKVLNVAQVTSNALALFQQYAAKFRAAAANNKP